METNFDLLEETPTELLTEVKSDTINPETLTGNTSTALNDIYNRPNESGQQGASFGTATGPQAQGGQFNPNNPQPQTMNAGSLINSEMAVAFIDIVVPVVFVLLFKRIHDKTISKKAIQLTSSEKETIKPVLQNYLNSINFAVDNPLNALILTLGFIYGVKYIEVSNQLPNGNFNTATPPANIGETTAQGTIKKDGRGRPKGTIKRPKQVI
jgi:hypothetical protein